MCPNCNSAESSVVDTRHLAAGSMIRRSRRCKNCGTRYTTYEVAIPRPLQIVKSNGSVQPFRMDKLKHSIRKAYGKHELDEQVEELSALVLRDIIKLGEDEVSSLDVGKIVERHLRNDPVAFVRYATLCRRSKTIDEIQSILDETRRHEAARRAKRPGSSANREPG